VQRPFSSVCRPSSPSFLLSPFPSVMSFPSNRASSQRHRSQSVNTAGPSEYSHPNTALAGPSSQTTTSHPDQRYRHFPTEYIEPSYSPSNPPEGRSPAVEDHTQADFYSATASYYQRQDSSEGTMMMSQRDMKYEYPARIMPTY
jgi:hypothetical protein